MIRTLIVDDEPLSRERLRALLARIEDVEVVGECGGGVDALQRIQELRPDLVFLDVQMPDVDGFEVVAQMDLDTAPVVVFATAYDEYALRAFDASAVDYLVKPIGFVRLEAALSKVRGSLRAQEAGPPVLDPRLQVLLARLPPTGVHRDRFAIRIGGRYTIVRAVDLTWIGAADNYVELHTATSVHVHRSTMAEMEALLDPRRFLRIHRSVIINVDHVCSIEPWAVGEHCFVMHDGTKLTSSRTYKQAVRAIFGC